jgi:hypothetical protein
VGLERMAVATSVIISYPKLYNRIPDLKDWYRWRHSGCSARHAAVCLSRNMLLTLPPSEKGVIIGSPANMSPGGSEVGLRVTHTSVHLGRIWTQQCLLFQSMESRSPSHTHVSAFGPYLNTTMSIIPINGNRTVKSVAVDAFQKK